MTPTTSSTSTRTSTREAEGGPNSVSTRTGLETVDPPTSEIPCCCKGFSLVVCRGIDDHGQRLSRFAASPRGGPVCQVPPRLGSQGDRSPVPRRAGDSVCVAVRAVGRCPSVRFLTLSPGFRGIDERRRPSRGGPPVRSAKRPPSARVAGRPLAGPPPGGRPRLCGGPCGWQVSLGSVSYAHPPVSGGSTSAAGRVEGVRQCVAARCPLDSGRRATACRSPADRETAFVWPSPVCGVGHPAVQSRGHQLDDAPLAHPEVNRDLAGFDPNLLIRRSSSEVRGRPQSSTRPSA
jgi:hypothetical protein